MKPLYTIVVFVTLLCCSVWAGMHSYRCVEEEMVADMSQALAACALMKPHRQGSSAENDNIVFT
jgi:hypothetical protein